MAHTVNDLTSALERTGLRDQDPLLELQRACRATIKSGREMLERERHAKTLITVPDITPDEVTIAISRLKGSTNAFIDNIKSRDKSLAVFISTSLIASAPHSPVIERLLVYFESSIRAVIERTLCTSTDGDIPQYMYAEACFKESIEGQLSAEDCFDHLVEQALASPFEFYTEVYQNRTKTKRAHVAEFKETWARFWATVVQRSPGGSTLFLPPSPTSLRIFQRLQVPRYLFRVFDCGSSGLNDETLIASEAYKHASTRPDAPLIDDLFFKVQSDATSELSNHLKKGFWAADVNDNLMSWSSSLLFVLQYAIYRRRYLKDYHDVYIVVVDTSLFPSGQFARDLDLFRMLDGHSSALSSLKDIRHLRENTVYDNGEFLSQGVVSLQRRTWQVSLRSLIQEGLYNLYPEFDHEESKGKNWTNRVKDLRHTWSSLESTPLWDLEAACKLANNCFLGFNRGLNSFDMALSFLTFKNRKCVADFDQKDDGGRQVNDVFPAPSAKGQHPGDNRPDGPVEVQRFLALYNHSALQSLRSDLSGRFTSFTPEDLMRIFETMTW